MKYILDVVLKAGAIVAAIATALYLVTPIMARMIGDWWSVNRRVFLYAKSIYIEKFRNRDILLGNGEAEQEFVWSDPLE